MPACFWCALTNWTHIAIAYRDGKPTLFLNGKKVHQGLQSDYRVHPGFGVKQGGINGPFWGGLGEVKTLAIDLGEAEIERLMQVTPIPDEPAATPEVELFHTEGAALKARVWKAGSYMATTARGHTLQWEVPTLPEIVELSGPWDLRFPPAWGAPEKVRLDHLISWTDHPEAGVKFFSGTAVYHKKFPAPKPLRAKNHRWYLDLGKVAVMAEVNLNGRQLGTLWKPPFRMDVTDDLKAENVLEIKVTNLWVNRMIGDEQLPEDSDRNDNGTLKQWPQWLLDGQPSPTGRYTFSSWRLWKGDSQLRQSGLLGPVCLLPVNEVRVGQ